MPLEAPKELNSQDPWNPSDLAFGSNGCVSLQNTAGAKVSNVFDLCIQIFLHDISYKLCSRIAGFLGCKGAGGARPWVGMSPFKV